MPKSEEPSDVEELAAEYVLGTLDPASVQWVEERMSADPVLRSLVVAWEKRLAPLARAIAPVEPPASVLDQINAQLDRDTTLQTATGTIFAEEGEWVAIANGVHVKVLAHDESNQSRSFLLRMAPGSRLPPHRHTAVEECMMVTGDLTLGGVALRAGDYHRMPGGTLHPPGFSRSGCTAFIRADARSEST